MTSSERLLLVEDNYDIRNAFAYILMSYGYDVLECANGATAIEEAIKRLPDVAIIDVGLPDIDGFKVASKIRQVERQYVGGHDRVILVALTASDQLPTPMQTKEAEFDLYFAKPIKPQTVYREIQEIKTTRLENTAHD